MRFVGIGTVYQNLQRLDIGGAERIQIYVILSCNLVHEFAFEHESANVAKVWVEIEPLLEVRLGELEIGLSVFGGCPKRYWERGEPYPRIVDEHGFCAGRIVQRYTGKRGVGDRLLVKYPGARLAEHGRKSALGQRQGFPNRQGRRVAWPSRIVTHGERFAAYGIAHRGAFGIERPQEGQDGADCGLLTIREGEVRAHRVIEFHAEGRNASVVRASVYPHITFAILVGERRIGVGSVFFRRRVFVSGNRNHFGVLYQSIGIHRQW